MSRSNLQIHTLATGFLVPGSRCSGEEMRMRNGKSCRQPKDPLTEEREISGLFLASTGMPRQTEQPQ